MSREVKIDEDLVALVGEKRERRSWWRERPEGLGCERWEMGLMVAVLLFAIGACFVVAYALDKQEEIRRAEEAQAEAEFQAEMLEVIGRKVVR